MVVLWEQQGGRWRSWRRPEAQLEAQCEAYSDRTQSQQTGEGWGWGDREAVKGLILQSTLIFAGQGAVAAQAAKK